MAKIPPELLADAADHGITVCGGGALIFDIAERLSKDLSIRCKASAEPTLAKARGMSFMIKNDDLFESNGYSFIFKDDIRDRLRKVDKF